MFDHLRQLVAIQDNILVESRSSPQVSTIDVRLVLDLLHSGKIVRFFGVRQ